MVYRGKFLIMEFINEYVKEVIGFILITGIVMNLIPDKSLSKYIRMVIGIILIVLMLNPLFEIYGVDVNELFKAWETQINVNTLEDGEIKSVKIDNVDISIN